MDCLALFDSGNYAIGLCGILERMGYVFELVSIPCRIAKTGCGYCLRFPEDYKEMVVGEGRSNGFPVREIYRIIPEFSKNAYKKIY